MQYRSTVERGLIGERYRRLEILQEDSAYTLYRGWDERIGRAVTLNVLAVADARALKRFEREARILGGSNHPSLIPVYAVELEQEPPYMVLGPVSGHSVRTTISTLGPRPWQEVQRWIGSLLQALVHAHGKGFVHHDLKPQVFFVDPESGTSRLLGFGRLQLIGGHASTLEKQAAVPAYWAPEQFLSDQIDPRSDLYGAAAIAYYALTGSDPIELPDHTNVAEALERVMAGVSEPPSANFDVPTELDGWFLRALAKDPRHRFQSAREMFDALGAWDVGTLPASKHPPPDPAMVNDVIDGRYRLRARLGSGAMSTVFLAMDQQSHRDVAVKVLTSHSASAQSGLLEEWLALRALSHPNIVEVFHAGSHNGAPYLVLEHIAGYSIAEELRRQRGHIPLWRTLSIVEQVATGLEHVHSAGFAHGDVKPSNVLLAPGFRVCVVDFGLAQPKGHRASTFAGTPAYVAPELARGGARDVALASRADVYSLAIMTFELLTGTRPFRAATTDALLGMHLYETAPAPSSVDRRLAWVDEVLARALVKDPAARTPSCAQFRDELLRAALPEADADARLLLVEPDDGFAAFVENTLKRWMPSVRLHRVRDGGAARSAVRSGDVSMVMIAMDAPKLNAFEFAQYVRANFLEPPPVVVSHPSAATETMDWQLLASLGVSGLARAPLSEQSLVTLVMRLCSEKPNEEGRNTPGAGLPLLRRGGSTAPGKR